MRETDFRLLAEYAHDIICQVGADLVMSYASPSCHRLLGWKPEEMVGKGPDAFVHPDDLPVVAAAHRELIRHGSDKTPTVVRMLRKNGSYAWMEITARIVPEPEQDSAYTVVLVMRDIGARLNKHSVQRRSDRELHDRLKHAKGVISDFDLYVTNSGHVAFLQSIKQINPGKILIGGYIIESMNGRSIRRNLEWLPTGECVSSGDERDYIKRRA